MSVKAVKAIRIIGLMSELENVVKFCGDSEVFHPDDALSFYSDTKNFIPLNNKNPYSGPLQDLKSSAELVGLKLEYVDIRKFNASTRSTLKYVRYFNSKVEALMNEKLRTEQEIDKYRNTIEQVGPFIGSDIDFTEIMNCQFITPNFGRMPIDSYEKLTQYSNNPYVLFFPLKEDDTHCWGVYFSPPEQKEDVDRIFSSLLFERLDVPPIEGTPDNYINQMEEELSVLRKDLEKINSRIKAFLDSEKEKCMQYYSKLEEFDSYEEITHHVYKYHKSFILVGWIPSDKEDYFTKHLDRIQSVEYSLSDGKEELKHSPPVILKNPPFIRLYEFFVKMYGMPSYNEIDPTPFVAFTYTLFFGIMFGDMGQGLCVAVVGELMWKLKKMEVGKILIPCGISGMIFGFLYGSVFGFEHALDPVHQALFGIKEGKLMEVMESQTINMIIYGSVAIGIVTIIFAMLTNIVSSLKRHDMENALFGANGVAGFVFYIAVVAGLVCQIMLGVELMTPVYIICLIILPLILMFMREPFGKLAEGRKNWQPQKWGDYCIQSFFELFEMCLSYVTNTMSFLRVGAYILVHAGMMLVVFTLAEMVGGEIGYTLVVIIGNGVVMALEALLVAIQVLRLDYYEVFSRFYVGEGRPFMPVRARKNNV